MTYAVAALVDIDDFIASERAQGQAGARGQLQRAGEAVHDAARALPGALCLPRPPEEWLVLLTGADPDTLVSDATALAEDVSMRIARATA